MSDSVKEAHQVKITKDPENPASYLVEVLDLKIGIENDLADGLCTVVGLLIKGYIDAYPKIALVVSDDPIVALGAAREIQKAFERVEAIFSAFADAENFLRGEGKMKEADEAKSRLSEIEPSVVLLRQSHKEQVESLIEQVMRQDQYEPVTRYNVSPDEDPEQETNPGRRLKIRVARWARAQQMIPDLFGDDPDKAAAAQEALTQAHIEALPLINDVREVAGLLREQGKTEQADQLMALIDKISMQVKRGLSAAATA